MLFAGRRHRCSSDPRSHRSRGWYYKWYGF